MIFAFVLLLISCTASEGDHGHSWAYAGNHGPSHWSHYYHKCEGKRQSPINLSKDSLCVHKFPSFKLEHFGSVADGTRFTIKNNGHAVQVDISPRNSEDYTTSGGGLPGTYIPLQFHFHWGSKSSRGSEHQINGKAFPMELHIVHRNSKYSTTTEAIKHSDGLAVLGAFFKVSKSPNPTIDRLIKHFPSIIYPGYSAKMVPFPLLSLLPDNTDNFYRYMGSLTTPSCNEAVVWTLFDQAMPISQGQLRNFRLLLNGHGNKLSDNFRPIQKTNHRVVLKSFY